MNSNSCYCTTRRITRRVVVCIATRKGCECAYTCARPCAHRQVFACASWFARATRDYIDIIDDFVGKLKCFYAVSPWSRATRPYKATAFQAEISKNLYWISNNKTSNRSSTAPHHTCKNSVVLCVILVNSVTNKYCILIAKTINHSSTEWIITKSCVHRQACLHVRAGLRVRRETTLILLMILSGK
jgi:hypothetical protein